MTYWCPRRKSPKAKQESSGHEQFCISADQKPERYALLFSVSFGDCTAAPLLHSQDLVYACTTIFHDFRGQHSPSQRLPANLAKIQSTFHPHGPLSLYRSVHS